MKSEFVWSVAAGAAVAHARGRRRRSLQPEVRESAVQLAPDLVEHLLAGDQLVCGDPQGQSHATNLVSRGTHSCILGLSRLVKIVFPSAIVLVIYFYLEHKKHHFTLVCIFTESVLIDVRWVLYSIFRQF